MGVRVDKVRTMWYIYYCKGGHMKRETKTDKIWIRVSKEEKQELMEKAKKNSRTLSNFILWTCKRVK